MSDERYVPAAGWRALTPLFDPVMAVTTRERRRRGEVVDEALATSPATVLDVGCGTGTLVVQLARRAPDVRVIGLDGDPDILTRAAAKAQAASLKVELLNGTADVIPLDDASVDCAVSTLVFHHLAPDTTGRALAEIRRVLRPGHRFVIADYGRPHDPLMRAAFFYVQLLDGFPSTRQHAAGQFPQLIAEAGLTIRTVSRLRTVSGTLELLACSVAVAGRYEPGLVGERDEPGAVVEVELLQDVADVTLRCQGADDEPTGDLGVAQCAGDEQQDVAFAACEFG